MMKELSIYIHIPFCSKKCYYCDFLSFSNFEHEFENYKNTLINEIENFNSSDYLIISIFVGGGTPSVFPPLYISEILSTIFDKFRISDDCEITIESNPKTLSKEKLEIYKKSKINRLSIGLQSDNQNLLRELGRIHSKEDFLENFEMARNIGFDNINVDLMFGLPNQTISIWKETINTIINCNPEHISAYSLILEEGTFLYNEVKNNNLTMITEDLDREMYYYMIDIFKKNGFNQYETSNFSKAGKECKHNKVYWKRKEYVGFGLGAAGFLDNYRVYNTSDFKEYVKGNIIDYKEKIEGKDAYSEFMFLGLRMNEGVNISDFKSEFNKDLLDVYRSQITSLRELELIIVENDKIKLTNKGIDLSNQVFVEFI